MYEQGEPLGLWPKRSDFAGPVKLVGADPERERPSPTALSNQALAEAGGFDYAAIRDTSHLLQLEVAGGMRGGGAGFLGTAGLR